METVRNSDETLDVAELLTGLPMRAEPIQHSLDKLHQRLEHVVVSNAELANEIRTVRKALSAETTDCPRLFTLVPRDKGKWNPKQAWEADFELTLWCEHPGHEHPCAGAQYTIASPKEWLKTAAPYLSVVAKTLRIAVPIAGAALGVAMDQAALTDIKDDNKFMDKLSGALPVEVGRGPAPLDQRPGLSPAEGAGLRALRQLLFERDKQRSFGGMRRVLTASGDYLWVCPTHYPEYDPGLPTLPYQ